MGVPTGSAIKQREQSRGRSSLSHRKLLLPTPARGDRLRSSAPFYLESWGEIVHQTKQIGVKCPYFCITALSAAEVPQMPEDSVMVEHSSSERFVPKGAIAFFAALAIFYAMLWFAVYVELLGRR